MLPGDGAIGGQAVIPNGGGMITGAGNARLAFLDEYPTSLRFFLLGC